MRIIQNDRGRNARTAGFRAQARGSGAFSFGDLLVVIAVVAVLSAVVVPIMAKKSAATRQAQCVSN